MKLTEADADLFLDLTWSLQFFVNNELQIIPNVRTREDYTDLPTAEKIKIRAKIYSQPELIDRYISANPDELNNEHLTIVKQWQNFVEGNFYIERFLKGHTIFIGEDKVYGVLGLHEGIDQFYLKSHLPVYVKAVLLPFRGIIVYDGLMQGYNVFFGGGIKRSLKETYMQAKQNDKIITALGERKALQKTTKTKTVQKDWSQEIEQILSISKKLKGGNGQPMINSPVFSLVKASIELANTALTDPSDFSALLKDLKKVERAASKVETTLYRMD
ncbi:MAG: hypothetical protein O2890_14100 [Cyanobacteria bacterium]|nr:hypothetical protein [Cyanobacteriota bacterium]MDA0867511.1 hypothetical protein [Cyanobacteriota bacterium]